MRLPSETGDSPPPRETYYTRHPASRVQCQFELDTARTTVSGRHFSRLTYKFYGAWWLRVATGDASVDSWFREIHVPRAWSVYLATGFDFRENDRACFGSIGVPTLASVSYLV